MFGSRLLLWTLRVPADPSVCHVIRESSRPPGPQQHDRPGAAAHQKLPAGHREDPEGGGEAVRARQRHRLQRLRRAGPSQPGQGETHRHTPARELRAVSEVDVWT